MKIPKELDGARLNITRTAELFRMNAGHLRRLSRRGVLPAPKRTAVKSMPFYDFELLTQISEVLRSGVGLNQEEISFYGRSKKTLKNRTKRAKGRAQPSPDAFVESVVEGCKELGIAKERLDVEIVKKIIVDEFGKDGAELRQVIPVVARRLLRDDG